MTTDLREPGELSARDLDTMMLITAFEVAPDQVLGHIDRRLDAVESFMAAGLSFEEAWTAAGGS